MYAEELNVSRSTEYVKHLDLQSRPITIEVDGGVTYMSGNSTKLRIEDSVGTPRDVTFRSTQSKIVSAARTLVFSLRGGL